MSNSYANTLTIVHEGDGLQFIALSPDVCKTPSPGGPVPLPYPNIAMSSDLADGSKTVKVEGNSAALESSNLKTSTGDEAGTAGGGVVSSKIKGKLKWLLYSMDVKFEGKGVVRFLDDCMHNGNAGNAPGKDRGMKYPGHEGDINCDNCGQKLDSPGHVQLKTSSESDEAAVNTKGRTTAAVVVKCPGQRPASFTGVAGNNLSKLNVNTFAALAKNFKSGKAIPLKEASPPPGNCAEQKALYDAFSSGKMGPDCEVNMSAMREKRGGGKQRVPACPTCQRVLTSMLCQNKAKA
jgi:cytidine deaminase